MADVAALLGSARVAGFAFPPDAGWVSFVYDADEPPGRARFDRILAANSGLLVHWDFDEEHGCNVTLYEGRKSVGRIKVSFISKRSTFDRDAFVTRGLLSEKGASEIATWLENVVPSYLVAEQLGLPVFGFLDFQAVADFVAAPPAGSESSPLAKALPISASGRIRSSEPPLAIEELELSDGALASGSDSDEPDGPPASATNRWDMLAGAVLQKWLAAGKLELEDDEAEASLADALADILAEQPSAEALEEALLERPEVAELFASGTELLQSARSR